MGSNYSVEPEPFILAAWGSRAKFVFILLQHFQPSLFTVPVL